MNKDFTFLLVASGVVLGITISLIILTVNGVI
jgi:hypothetical protein